jgi:conjugal transfer mating pair stabilization protein TraG
MYELIVIGGGEYYVDVFNGLAMLINSESYLGIVKIALSLAFMMAILNSALSGSLNESVKWFITTFILTQLLLYPKATIHITDKTNPTIQGAKIDNVPFVIAYGASTASKIGYSLTKQFEAVYSLPDDLKYSQNGMIFGVNLLKALQNVQISNANLANSINNFIQNCIFFDLEYGIYSFEDLKKSDDIWSLIKAKQVENRFFTYTDSSSKTTYPTCKQGASNLDNDWQNEYNNPEILKNISFFSAKPNLTKTILSQATPLLNEYFFDLSKASNQMLQQAMMINAINTATENYEAENQIQTYQDARATLQAKSTYQTMGNQAGMWIPILKIVIEIVFYGAFPLVILVAMIPNLTASVLRGYFITFFWLSSWGPIYAILHRIIMGHGKTYTLSLTKGIGLTLSNQPALDQIMNNISAMAGYMSIFVPMLAFGIARGGASVMSSMTTSFMAGVQGAVANASQEGVTGNLSFGNVGLNQRQSHSGVAITNDAGQVIHHHNDGTNSIDNSQVESRLGIDVRGSNRIENALTNQINNEQSLAQTKSIQASQTKAHGFEMMINNHRSIENSEGFEKSFSAEEKSSFNKINNAVSDFAQERGISREKSAEIFGSIGIEASKGFNIAGFGLNGQISGKKSWALKDSDQENFKEALNFSNQRSLSKDFANVESVVNANRLNYTDSKGESINQTFNNANSLIKESGQHYENAQRYSEQQQYVKSHSAEIDRNYNQELWGELVDKYGVHQASEITNPSNQNKAVFNDEIDKFMENKIVKITKSDSPDFNEQYKNNEINIQKSFNSNQVKGYDFVTQKSVDNSNLAQEVPNKISATDKSIIEQYQVNKSVGDEVENKVRKEQNEGL